MTSQHLYFSESVAKGFHFFQTLDFLSFCLLASDSKVKADLRLRVNGVKIPDLGDFSEE